MGNYAWDVIHCVDNMGIAYTHKIIGPIYKTCILLRAAASGNIPLGKIKFRKNDKFKELEHDITSCFETMQKYKQGICE